jgi:hydroxyethylthiazole kinase-like uncharacterized protein yjeF
MPGLYENPITIINEAWLREHHPPRPRDANKFSFGRVLILAGSRGMQGAAILSAMGALRAGAGLVAIASARSLQDSLAHRPAPLMTRSLEDRDGLLGPWSNKDFEALLPHWDAIVIGPGLGQHPALRFWLLNSLPSWSEQRPLVLDADALNILSDPQDRARLSEQCIATPHMGELGRWLGVRGAELQEDRPRALERGLQKWRGALIVKGAGTLIGQGSEAGANRAMVALGNPGMATAGSGDVLSGILGALLARGLPAYAAACFGAGLHALAGDLAAEAWSEEAMSAEEILGELSKAWKRIKGA